MVIVNNLCICIANQILLSNISCSLLPGRITTFIGKSGAGKTTVLKSMVGLMAIKNGTIEINNKPLSALTSVQRAQEIGYVFQDFNLFPHYTVWQNCADPLIIQKMPSNQMQQHINTVLKELNMNDYAAKYPSELSGGQQQRVAIARALCLNPSVLLLDEPTASLDPINTDILVSILKRLASQGLTIGISSQDMDFVRKIFDRVYYIDQGNIIEYCDAPSKIEEFPAINQFLYTH